MLTGLVFVARRLTPEPESAVVLWMTRRTPLASMRRVIEAAGTIPKSGRRHRFLLTWQRRRAFVQGRRHGLGTAGLGGGSFLAPAAYRLIGDVDEAALARAVQAIVDRIDALRTTFDVSGAEPVAVTHSHLSVFVLVEEEELLRCGIDARRGACDDR